MKKRNGKTVFGSIALDYTPYTGKEKECKTIKDNLIIRRQGKMYYVYRNKAVIGSFGELQDAQDFVNKFSN